MPLGVIVTVAVRIDPRSFLLFFAYLHKTPRGPGGPDLGPVDPNIHWAARDRGTSQGHLLSFCFDRVSWSLGDSSLQWACGMQT